jgi:Methylase involved in ubiquinone/menaquinone biosynthesis
MLAGMSLRQQAGRVARRMRRTIDGQVPLAGHDVIDVRKLLDTYTVDELSEAADEYYRNNLDGIDYYYAKPVANIDEAPDLLISFAQVLAGVRPIRGMRVLDFGAGTGWTSRMLTQLGCEVVVCDVSATALDIAKDLFERQPVAGDQPAPTFLRWDGFRFDLADESIDRIFCFDAFHHVPNPATVLAEMGRVLKPGGVAGFQEPGPNHSKSAQSQFEMKQFTVIENDIIMGNIEQWAGDAGFTDVKLAVFTSDQFQTSIEGYNDFLAGGVTRTHHYKHMRPFVAERRIFFLSKGERATADSRERQGLDAQLEILLDVTSIAAGSSIVGHARATNIGTTRWLPSDAPIGPVLLGVHLRDVAGKYLDRDYARIALPRGSDGRQNGSREGGRGVAGGETADFDFELTAPDTPGEYKLEFDLVAEHVAWFELNGVPTVSVPLAVT